MSFNYLIRLIKSPASLYVILRYFTYVLQFLNSILLVNVLGDYSYGIYGFILMFSVYAIYLNLGLNESLNAEYAINKSDKSITSQLWNNTLSFAITWYCIIAIATFTTLHYIPNIFSKYEFSNYGYLLIATCIIHNISSIYATLYKIHGKTIKINIQQIVPQIGVLFIVILGHRIASIKMIVWALFITNLISLIICIIKTPEHFKINFNFKIIITLLKRGVSLLCYNLSFQLLTMLALAVVSFIYTVEQMGCYSLANSITNGVIMAGGAFLFIFSPKIINKMRTSCESSKYLIKKFEQIYNVFIDFASILSIILVLFLSYAFPEYGTAFVKIYTILIISRIINNASTCYSTYLIAIKKESKLVICGFTSLMFAGIGYFIISRYKYPIFVIPVIIMSSSMLFSCMVIMIGQINLYGVIQWKETTKLLLGQNKWIIVIIGITYSYCFDSSLILYFGFLLYIIMNQNNIINSIKLGYKIVSEKNALKF